MDWQYEKNTEEQLDVYKQFQIQGRQLVFEQHYMQFDAPARHICRKPISWVELEIVKTRMKCVMFTNQWEIGNNKKIKEAYVSDNSCIYKFIILPENICFVHKIVSYEYMSK